MDRFLQDLRFALTSIRRRPLVAGAVIVTLGLGIGASAGIFRAFNAAFLRPLPFAEEGRLVRIFLSDPTRGANLSPRADVFLALRDNARSFSGIAGQRYNDFTAVIDGGEPLRMAGIEVSEGWSRVLGVQPLVGRAFSPDEERQGRDAGVALISHHTWLDRLGGEASAIGAPVTLDGRSFTVIGVLPPGLRFPYESELWIPSRFDHDLESTWGLNIVARLADGVSMTQMSDELEALTSRLPEVRAHTGMTLTGKPLRAVLIDDEGPLLVALSLAVAFLLLLVTVNVANLLMAHSLARQREIAIRTALGAGLGRHLGQAMTEGFVLAAAGAVVGLAVAKGSGSLLWYLVPGDFSYVLGDLPFDWRVLLFTLLVAAVAGCAFGAIPALRLASRPSSPALTGGARAGESRSSRRFSSSLTAAQIAFALVLLTAALAMARDFEQRASRDLGYDANDLFTFSVVLPAERYPDAPRRERFFDELATSLAAVPGAESAGTVNLFPAAGQGAILSPIEGQGVPFDATAPLIAHSRFVHGRLLDAMEVRLLKGRLFAPGELLRGDRVAIVSRSLAAALWPGADPIGRQLRSRRGEDAPWVSVIGVIEDLQEFYGDHSRSLWQPVKLYSDLPLTAQMVGVVRLSGGGGGAPAGIDEALRSAVRQVDPSLAVFDLATARDRYAESLASRRAARALTVAFAMLGLVIAAIGVYATMAFSVSRRVREIGVRMALGGSPGAVARYFLGGSAVVVGAGLALGITAVAALARRFSGVVEGSDPVAVAALAAATLAAVALISAWIPLRRATRIDPASVLSGD